MVGAMAVGLVEDWVEERVVDWAGGWVEGQAAVLTGAEGWVEEVMGMGQEGVVMVEEGWVVVVIGEGLGGAVMGGEGWVAEVTGIG